MRDNPIDSLKAKEGYPMKTYILYTLCLQKLTVSRCNDYAHALEKAGLKTSEVFKHEVIEPA